MKTKLKQKIILLAGVVWTLGSWSLSAQANCCADPEDEGVYVNQRVFEESPDERIAEFSAEEWEELQDTVAEIEVHGLHVMEFLVAQGMLGTPTSEWDRADIRAYIKDAEGFVKSLNTLLPLYKRDVMKKYVQLLEVDPDEFEDQIEENIRVANNLIETARGLLDQYELRNSI